MTSIHIRVVIISTAVLLSSLYTNAQNGNNPIEDALLRWYPANLAVQIHTCSQPEGLVFDGSNIWVACGGAATDANQLQKFAASDGSGPLISVPAVSAPYALAYDGANIWVSSTNNATVTEVRASDGVILTATPLNVGAGPKGMAFDGSSVWVADGGSTGSLTKIDVKTATVVNTYSLASAPCSTPWGVAFDGTSLWVACTLSNTVVRFNPSTNTVTAVVGGFSFLSFITYDGANVWVTSNAGASPGKLYKFSAASPPTSVGMSNIINVGNTPYGIAYDTQFIWVANGGDNTVTKVLASTGAVVNTYMTSQPPPLMPDFVAFDGGNIWVSNSQGGSISKF